MITRSIVAAVAIVLGAAYPVVAADAVEGGAVAVDGGTVAVDGGTVAVDGGTVAVDGGTVEDSTSECPATGTWLAPDGMEVLRPDAALAAFADRPVVLLGEHHDEPDHHRWQLDTIAGLHALRPDMVLGFEMFPRRVQLVLDRWVNGELGEKDFLAAVDWGEIWGFDPRLYLPLFHFARLHRVPMVALNVDRDLVKGVADEGWDAVSEARREGVTDPAAATDAYRRSLAEVYEAKRRRMAEQAAGDDAAVPDTAVPETAVPETAVPETAVPDTAVPDTADATSQDEPAAEAAERPSAAEEELAFTRFVEAQLTWDRAMAQGLAEAAAREGNPLVVGIIGTGHLEHRWGVPHQLTDLGIADAAVLLPWPRGDCRSAEPDVADALFLLEPEQPAAQAKGPRLGVTTSPHPDGVRVVEVEEDGTGAVAGLLEGDVILSVAGGNARNDADLARLVEAQAPGTSVSVIIRRDGETMQLLARFDQPETDR